MLCKREDLQNRQCIKYLFSPLYIPKVFPKWNVRVVGMGIYKNLTIPILLIVPIPYRFSYRFSLGEKISTNVFVCIKSL